MDYVYKIKFLNLPLIGRELLLREGMFSIGSGDCDVWFAFVENDVKDIKFEVTSQGIRLLQTSKIWCNGVEQIITADEYLPLHTSLDIAGVQFALGESESSLDGLISVTRQDATGPVHSNKYTLAIVIALIAVSVILLGTAGYMIHDAQAEDSTILPYVDVQKKIAEVENQHALPGVKFSWLQRGELQISGQCKSEKLLQPVLDFLKSNNINYVMDVVCDDRLIKNVTDVLQLNGYDRVLAYMDNAPGKVIISGQIEEDRRWQQVVNLLNDVQGLRSWSVKSVNDKELDGLINELRQSKLLPLLSVQRVDERIVVSGRLSSKDRDVLYSLIRNHMQSFPEAEEIIYQNISTSSSSLGILPAPVASVGGNNDFPYIILEDGTRLQKGAVLPGGYLIANIDSINGIELSKQGELLHLPLGL
ncbi:TPA: type III secretion system inner membrane ring subunit SctD [Citrobacter werkmanii]